MIIALLGLYIACGMLAYMMISMLLTDDEDLVDKLILAYLIGFPVSTLFVVCFGHYFLT